MNTPTDTTVKPRGFRSGGNNVSQIMGVVENLANLGFSISDSQNVPSSENMTGQELEQIQSRKDANVTGSVISTLVSIASFVLAAL